jgi:hypothetical protein
MIAQTKVILLSSAVVLVEKAVDRQLPGPDDVIEERWHSEVYKPGEQRSLGRTPPNIEMELERVPDELDWDKAGLNQLLALVFPDGQVMLAYGWISPCANGVTIHLSNLNISKEEEGPTMIPAPGSYERDEE